MAPSNPKRPSRPRGNAPPVDPRKKTEIDLPFDDVEPLRADDPAPQHVPQFPSDSRKAAVLKAPPDDDETTSALPKPGRYHTPVEPLDEPLPSKYAQEDISEPGFSAASLYVERGPGIGQLAPLRQGTLLIGRGSSANLRLQHPSISRRHAQVNRRGERFFIRDLGSQNGTYVNQIRIEREVEIFPGDELVLGTSQLRMRGANGATTSTRSRPDLMPKRREGPSVVAIAVASGAIGVGLATAIIFLVFKYLHGPSYEQVAPPEQPAAVQTEHLPPAPPIPAAVAGAPEKVLENAEAEPEPEPAAKPEPEAAAPQAQKPAPTPAPEPAPKRSTPKVAAAPKKQEPAPAAEPSDPAVMARYEEGKAADALALAKRKNLTGLAARLAKFVAAYDGAQKALAAQDEISAFKNLEAALKLDQELEGGWGKYNSDIRHQLSALHTLAASRQAKAGDTAAARKSLQQAVKLDPENSAAKAELHKLGGAKEEPKSRSSAIDEAFGSH